MLIFKLLWQPSSEGLSGIKVVQNVKSIRQAVFKISRSQAIVDGRTDGPADKRIGPFHNTSGLSTGV